jgi:hypothetical protein
MHGMRAVDTSRSAIGKRSWGSARTEHGGGAAAEARSSTQSRALLSAKVPEPDGLIERASRRLHNTHGRPGLTVLAPAHTTATHTRNGVSTLREMTKADTRLVWHAVPVPVR